MLLSLTSFAPLTSLIPKRASPRMEESLPSHQGNALLASKRRPLQIEETPSSNQRRATLTSMTCHPSHQRRATSRDRRPRLSAQGNMINYDARDFWRTDEGVCPYRWALFPIGKNHPNWLPLGTPPLGGGWVGFPSEVLLSNFKRI